MSIMESNSDLGQVSNQARAQIVALAQARLMLRRYRRHALSPQHAEIAGHLIEAIRWLEGLPGADETGAAEGR